LLDYFSKKAARARQKYGVMGVPKTVINEKVKFLGAVSESVFLEHVLLAACRPEYAR
jgi:predicted DsbA family dithiol-disulfide isomerase